MSLLCPPRPSTHDWNAPDNRSTLLSSLQLPNTLTLQISTFLRHSKGLINAPLINEQHNDKKTTTTHDSRVINPLQLFLLPYDVSQAKLKPPWSQLVYPQTKLQTPNQLLNQNTHTTVVPRVFPKRNRLAGPTSTPCHQLLPT